jgi:hypothetical protein
VLKVMLHFRRVFRGEQERGRYVDASFFHAPGKVFPTFWTALPARTSLLNAWVGGPSAGRLCELVAVGGAKAREVLASPLEGTLFFAGEAPDTTGDAATVTGALRSGARAALEIGRHLEGRR